MRAGSQGRSCKISAEQQDLLAAELMERLWLLEQPPTGLSPDVQAKLDVALAAAWHGEFASDAELETIYSKRSL